MAIELSSLDLDTIDTAAATRRILQFTELMEGLGAGIEVREGAVHDLMIRPAAVLWQAASDRLDRIAASSVPLSQANAEGIESDILSAVAAASGVRRQPEAAATGLVYITIDNPQPIVIPARTVFESNDGRRFAATTVYVARTSPGEVVQPTDRLLTRVGDQYQFSILVTAEVAGSTGNLLSNRTLTAPSLIVPGLVEIRSGTITGGANQESDASLLTRLRRGSVAASSSTPRSLVAALTQVDAFPQWRAIQVICHDDTEMTRDKVGAMSLRPAADVYARTAVSPTRRNITVTATRTGDTSFVANIGRDDFAGTFSVVNVQTESNVRGRITLLTRGLDTSPADGRPAPIFQSTHEAFGSRFQTAQVYFDIQAERSVTELTVEITLFGMPSITEGQQYLSDIQTRFVGGDTLLKAVVPVFVAVRVELHTQGNVPQIDSLAARREIAQHINDSGFAGAIHGSRIADIVHRRLIGVADVAAVSAVTEIILPNGETLRERHKEHIRVPHRADLAVTHRTCNFFCDEDSIQIVALPEPQGTSL